MGCSGTCSRPVATRSPGPPRRWRPSSGRRGPRVEVVLVDVRGRDRTVVVQDLLTADGATISASFVVQYRVADPLAAIHRGQELRGAALHRSPDRRPPDAPGPEPRRDHGQSRRDRRGDAPPVRESAGGYGLEVSGLDFKDLIVPETSARLMNRAASPGGSARSRPPRAAARRPRATTTDDSSTADGRPRRARARAQVGRGRPMARQGPIRPARPDRRHRLRARRPRSAPRRRSAGRILEPGSVACPVRRSGRMHAIF